MDRETAPTGATNSTVSSPLGGLVFINAHVAGRNSGFTLNRHCVNCAVSACPLPVGELPAMFYRRRSQQKTLHLRPDFCGFPAPLVIEQDLFSLSAPKARDAADNRVALVGFSPCGFHDSIRDEASDL